MSNDGNFSRIVMLNHIRKAGDLPSVHIRSGLRQVAQTAGALGANHFISAPRETQFLTLGGIRIAELPEAVKGILHCLAQAFGPAGGRERAGR